MDTNSVLIIFLGALIYLFIIYQMIQSATKGPDIRDQLKIQNRLLIHLLKKNGVDIPEINKAIDPEWKLGKKETVIVEKEIE